MAMFWFRRDQAASREYMEADSLPEALLRLREQGVAAVEAGEDVPRPAGTDCPARWWMLTTAYEHLAGLLDEGSSLPDALRVLATEADNPRLRCSLAALADGAEEGETLSMAMARQPRLYDEVAVSAVAAAEAAGQLPEGLRGLAEEYRQERELTNRVLIPLFYPFVITCLAMSYMLFLVTFIAPKYFSLYYEMGMTVDRMPLVTRALVALGHVAPWEAWLLFIPAFSLLCFYLFRRNLRRGIFELPLLGLDVAMLGRAGLYVSVARACGSLGLLLRNRVELSLALRLAGRASGHSRLRQALSQAEYATAHGAGLTESLRASRLLPEEALFPLGAAEAAGDLPGELGRLAREYSQRASWAVQRSLWVAGPLIVVLLGLMVLFIGGALFAPLIGIIGELSGS